MSKEFMKHITYPENDFKETNLSHLEVLTRWRLQDVQLVVRNPRPTRANQPAGFIGDPV